MSGFDSAGAADTTGTGIPPLLAEWIVGQRWFTNTSSRDLEQVAEWTSPADGADVRTLLLRDTAAGAETLYQVPLVHRDDAADVIGPDGDGVLVDGARDPAFVAGLLALVLGGGVVDGEVRVEGVPIGWTGPAPTLVSAKVLSGEQSNTSIIIEARHADGSPAPGVIVKVFRALHDGENPDVVLQSAIAAAGSSRVPKTYGALVGEWPDAHAEGGRARGHLAVAQEFLAGTEDAWRVALRAARNGDDFTGPARDLGGATAEVHRVLADAMPTAQADDAAKAATAASMRSRAAQAAALVPSLGAAEHAIDRVLDAGAEGVWPTLQRIHGDFHLGQVLLVPDRGWVLLDFEGEPLRPMAERNLPDLPLRDVAGMLRSFDYVAGTIEQEGGDAAAARAWAEASRAAFLEGYGFDAEDGGAVALLAALELDKALYECVYEVRNRPAWLPIPERAVHRLLDAGTRAVPTEPPVAERRPLVREHHGDRVEDAYEWLRDKDDPAVVQHLEAENAWADARLAHLAPLRATIFDEIKRRTKETDLSVPVREGDWWYYSRSQEGKQYPKHCRAPIAGPDDWTPPTLDADAPGEQVLLDDEVEAAGHEFYSLGSFDVSADGRLLLWAVDTIGDERYVLRVKDLTTGELLPDVVDGTMPGALFDAAGDAVYYTTCDEAWRPDTVHRHVLNASSLGATGDDEVVLTEDDDRFWVGVGMTRSRRYLEIAVGSKITSETRLLDLEHPEAGWRTVWPRREGVEYGVEHAVLDGRDVLLILHNDGAEDFELVAVDPADPEGERDVVLPHTPGRRLEEVDAFAGFVALSYRQGGLARVGTLAADRSISELSFDEPLFTAGLGSNPEWAQPAIRVGFTSMVTPATVFDVDVATGARTVLKQQPVLGGYSSTDYEQRREWATAEDGTRVPVSIVARRGVLGAGPAPLLLYGYGSYEASIDPAFSIARLSLLDRGVVMAIAHVRGGGEMGRHWYEQGKTLTKKNTFSDFVACADHLIAEGFTTSDRMVAEGASAGGLLMGAVANLAPHDFAGIHAGVPFVDPLTSILDPSLPLTVIEWDEWGDPLHDAEVYAYMKSYSPVENVTAQAYPRILATTSLNDTRVLYVEPAKWAARLREVDADVLLKTEMSAGHGGVSGRYAAWHERAFELAWMLDVLGLA